MTSQAVYTNSGLFALNRVRYTTEPLTAYAINQSGSVTFKDLLYTEGTGELLQEMLDNGAMEQRIDAMEPKINARRRCNMTLTSYLRGTGVSASMGTAQLPTDNGVLLTAVMGGQAPSITMGVQTPNLADKFRTNYAGANNQLAGVAVGILNPSTGRLETARVRYANVTTGEMILGHTLQFVPATGSVVQSSVTNFLTQDTVRDYSTGVTTGSLQFYVQGATPTNNFVLMGLNGGISLKTEIGALPEISYKFDGGANWITGSASDTLDVATIPNAVPVPLVDGLAYFYPYSTNVLTGSSVGAVDVFSVEITPNITYADIVSERGVNNILRKRRQRAVPAATGKIVLYFNDRTYIDAMTNSTLYAFELQIGNTVGNTTMISCPRVKITSVKMVDAGGVAGQEITFDCMEDNNSTNTSGFEEIYFPFTDLAKSAFSIHTL